MKITRGKIDRSQKVVIYGPEGIGKSTFASKFPNPLFIDTEGSTMHLDVARLPKPRNWTELMEMIRTITESEEIKSEFETIVIDTVDWAETLCIEYVCGRYNKTGIEEFGYGAGYIYAKEEFTKFIYALDGLIRSGFHVVLTAHTQLRKFEEPDAQGAYDRYELKIGKRTGSHTAPIVKEWSDMLLFANYKTDVVRIDGTNKYKAMGGKRVMYTSRTPAFDAKNRHDLPAEMPFDYSSIAHVIKSQKKREIREDVREMMTVAGVTATEVQYAISKTKNGYAEYVSIADYDDDYIDNTVIPNWEALVDYITKNRG